MAAFSGNSDDRMKKLNSWRQQSTFCKCVVDMSKAWRSLPLYNFEFLIYLGILSRRMIWKMFMRNYELNLWFSCYDKLKHLYLSGCFHATRNICVNITDWLFFYDLLSICKISILWPLENHGDIQGFHANIQNRVICSNKPGLSRAKQDRYEHWICCHGTKVIALMNTQKQTRV